MKGIMLLTDNFEDIEAIGTVDLLRRANIEIDTVSMKDTKEVKTQTGFTILSDKTLLECILSDYDFLIIPGGKAVMQYHLESKTTETIVDYFMNRKALVAAICAAPAVLGKYGYLDGLHFTCFPSFEKFSEKGIYEKNLKVVHDQNIITGCSCGATYEFAHELISTIKSKAVADHILETIIYK